MFKVNEVSKMSGISIRTLRYYDSIDLLKPTKISNAGYRLYDDLALERLQTIMLFKELQFSLKTIKQIISTPDFDIKIALQQQIKLLKLKQNQISKLIDLANNLIKENGAKMDFKAFDTNEMDQYKAEVKAKWGNTQAYKEFEERAAKCGLNVNATNELMNKIKEIAELYYLPPKDQAVQKKVKALQELITQNYYTCTKEILAGLGQMYICDERFKSNIEKACGSGAADFVSSAIKTFCQ